jgi:hypothetical protein
LRNGATEAMLDETRKADPSRKVRAMAQSTSLRR